MIMHSQNDNLPLVKSEPVFESGVHASRDGDGHSLLALLDDRLHGRWKIALAAGMILGLAIGFVAYQLAPVRYSSTTGEASRCAVSVS